MKLMFTQMVYNLRGTLWNLQHNTMFYENHLLKQVNFISSYPSLKKITGRVQSHKEKAINPFTCVETTI